MKPSPFSIHERHHNEPENPFSLLSHYHANSGNAAADITVRGYNGAMHLVADIIRTAILALESENTSHTHVPEPNHHIAGVLAIALDLLPYEEAAFLDDLYRKHLHKQQDSGKEEMRLQREREGNYSTIRILGKKHKKSPFLTNPLN